MSLKCEQQLEEEHAVQLLISMIEWFLPYLCMASITTFQELLDRVAKLN